MAGLKDLWDYLSQLNVQDQQAGIPASGVYNPPQSLPQPPPMQMASPVAAPAVQQAQAVPNPVIASRPQSLSDRIAAALNPPPSNPIAGTDAYLGLPASQPQSQAQVPQAPQPQAAPIAAPAAPVAAAPSASGGSWTDALDDPTRMGYLQAGLNLLAALQDRRTARQALPRAIQGFIGGREAGRDAQYQRLQRGQVEAQVKARQEILDDPNTSPETKRLISLLSPTDYGRVVAAQEASKAEFGQRAALAGLQARAQENAPKTDIAKLNADFQAGRITAEERDAGLAKLTDTGSSSWQTAQDQNGRPYYVDPRTRQPVIGSDGNLLRPTDNRQNVISQGEGALRGEVEKRLAPIRSQISAYSTLESSLGQNSGAGDLAAIYQFMKALDPNSVVREGEFATASNSAGVPTAIVNYYNKLVNGERLSDSQRGDFLRTARDGLTALRKNVETDLSSYRDIANRQGYNANNVFLPINWPSMSAASGSMAQPSANRSAAPTMDEIQAEMKRRGLN